MCVCVRVSEPGGHCARVMVNMEANKDFINAVERIFPDKAAAKIIVSCSDGRNRAIQAGSVLSTPWMPTPDVYEGV